jgi:muconolactone delta-isomerase
MNKHMVIVTGRIDSKKLLKKLIKKTGKKVEIVSIKDEETNDEYHDMLVIMPPFVYEYGCCIKTEDLMMFNDENPNACAIM